MTIEYGAKFLKQLRKAPNNVQKAVRIRVEVFASDRFNPILNNHMLGGKLGGWRSINVTGDWRAIYREIDQGTVYFLELGTHSQLYG